MFFNFFKPRTAFPFVYILFLWTFEAKSDPCEDKTDYCKYYSMCNPSDPWFYENCKKTCNMCPGGCADKTLDCRLKRYSQCFLEKTWMKENCPEHCGYCGPCEDKTDHCKTYRTCNPSDPWFLINCKKTCNMCASKPSAGSCIDHYPRCQSKTYDRCISNMEEMKTDCAKQCGFCGSCEDVLDECKNYRICNKADPWFLRYCKKTCNLCAAKHSELNLPKPPKKKVPRGIGCMDYENCQHVTYERCMMDNKTQEDCPKHCGICGPCKDETDYCNNYHVCNIKDAWFLRNCKKKCNMCAINNESTKLSKVVSSKPLVEYKLFTGNFNFNEAREVCEEHGGELATIKSFAEEKLAEEATSVSNNPGCKKFGYMGESSDHCTAFIGLQRKGANEELQWINRVDTYRFWHFSEPYNISHGCALMNAYREPGWSVIPCNVEGNALCDLAPRTPYALIDGLFTYEEGVMECGYLGGKLAVIRSEKEQRLAMEDTKFRADRGCVRSGDACRAFIGLRVDGSSQKWVLGNSSYRYWASGEPRVDTGWKSCVAINVGGNGEWGVVSCTERLGVLCFLQMTC